MDDWWEGIDRPVLECLARDGVMEAGDLAEHVGLSAAAMSSVLALLAQEGRVAIARVELTGRGDHDPLRRLAPLVAADAAP